MSFSPSSPGAQGWRFPAEWARHEATWLSWPHNRETWPHNMNAVEAVWVAMVKALLPYEDVHVNVLDASHARHVARLFGGVPKGLFLHDIPTNDSWVRDHGPIFVTRPGEVAVTDWGYNAWGGKYPPFDLDDQVPSQVAEVLGMPRFDGGMILEGGSIETDGEGTLLVTESCLFEEGRNPELDRAGIETRLRDTLGVDRILWLPGADVSGDDTDGHVDNLARFTPEGVLLVAREVNPDDVNYRGLEENYQAALHLKNRQGEPFKVVPVPMPPVMVQHGLRVPCSYMNYYVANGVVLLPVYGGPEEDAVSALLAACFPGREIVAINTAAMIWGQGAIHCSTQQQPAAP